MDNFKKSEGKGIKCFLTFFYIFVAVIIIFVLFYSISFKNNDDNIVKVEKIVIEKSTLTLKYGETSVIQAELFPPTATNKNITWTSSDTSLVTVDENGKIKVIANRDGEVTITATTEEGKFSATSKITVKKVDTSVKVTSINMLTKTKIVKYGETITLKAELFPPTATNKNITWTSSDTSLVTVDENGKIKVIANRDGEVTITATTEEGKFSATSKITVKKSRHISKSNRSKN